MAVFTKEQDQVFEDRIVERLRSGQTAFGEQELAVIAEKFGLGPEEHPFGNQYTEENSPTKGVVAPGAPGFAPSPHLDTEQSDETDTSASAKAETEEDGYDSWNVDDLKDALRERELPVSGNKDELVARLEEDDEGNE